MIELGLDLAVKASLLIAQVGCPAGAVSALNNFYSWYLPRQTAPLSSTLQARRALLTPSLRAALIETSGPARQQHNKPELDFDPFFGVQVRARSFRLERCEQPNPLTTLVQLAVVSGWSKQRVSTHNLEVEMAKQGHHWQIRDVIYPILNEDGSATWRTDRLSTLLDQLLDLNAPSTTPQQF
jgi:adenosine deaminase